MVEATAHGDGIHRTVQYSVWRNDVEPEEGFSRELISVFAKKDQDWNAKTHPETKPGINTIMKAFQDQVSTQPQKHFLGTRGKDAAGAFGAYQWLTFAQVNENVVHLARGIKKLGLCPDFEAEDKTWRFCGIWARNRQEWLTTLLAGMHYNITNVGFYDAMNTKAVDFIMEQT